MIQDLRDILFLDIETVACAGELDAVDERLKIQWARKANGLRRTVEQPDDVLFKDRAGIFAEFGKIICIAVAKFAEGDGGELCLRTKTYYGHDEREVLSAFKAMLERLDPGTVKLCAHNGKEFDFPYLCRRMLINGIGLPGALNIAGRKPWEIPHLDTMEMWKFGDHRHYTSLDLLATVFNIPTSKTDLDGSQVNAVYYETGDLARIKDYCLRDVVVLAQLFLKLKAISLDVDVTVINA